LLVLFGLILGVTFIYVRLGRLSEIVIILSFLSFFYGSYSLTSWFLFYKKIDKLDNDIRNGIKSVGLSSILRYNFITKKVKLENGLMIDSFDLQEEWKKGDRFYIERLPTSEFVLKCEKTR
jgi:hypothetical protein